MICGACYFRWSDDGKTGLFTFRAMEGPVDATVAVPLSGRAMLPSLPPDGVRTVDALAKLPGALVIPGRPWAAVGRGLRAYTYYKVSAHYNIFQIPLQ